MDFGEILAQFEGGGKTRRMRKSCGKKANADEKTAMPQMPQDFAAQFDRYLDSHGVDVKKDEAEVRKKPVSPKSLPIDKVFDLHGLTVEEAEARLAAIVQEAQKSGWRKILIVHGKGNHSQGEPVLKKAVAAFIERCPSLGASGEADRNAGGSGATWVVLKNCGR